MSHRANSASRAVALCSAAALLSALFTFACVPDATVNDGQNGSQEDPLGSAARVTVTATATPTTATAGTEVDVTLTVTTQRKILGDVNLTIYAPNGSSAYTASWPNQQLTPGTPLVLIEPTLVDPTDPVGTYSVGVVVKRTGGGTIFSRSNLAQFTVGASSGADAGTAAGSDAGTACTPKTCSSVGATCGGVSDGCGGTLSCGSCASGSTCSINQCVAAGAFPQPTNVVYADHVAEWNVMCGDDHFAMDDPIVYPGQPGLSHMHTFYGNTSTNAFSTLASLSATSPSSCGRGMGTSDLSAYWVPSLMMLNPDGTSSVVKSSQTNVVYYRRSGGGMGPGVLPFPAGLRMIAGNSKATSDQSLSIVQWDCGGGGLESPHMYQCPGTAAAPIHASLVFPSCWDGVNLDSADHKSHMAYAAANGTCPADHPVSLPEITFEVDFPGIGGGPNYFLASGGIYSWHGDFIADWNNQVQNALVASCLNNPHECGDMNRSGSTLFRPNSDPEPITINLGGFPNTSPWP